MAITCACEVTSKGERLLVVAKHYPSLLLKYPGQLVVYDLKAKRTKRHIRLPSFHLFDEVHSYATHMVFAPASVRANHEKLMSDF